MKRFSGHMLITILLFIVSWIWINKVIDNATTQNIKKDPDVQSQKASESVKDIPVMVKAFEAPVKVNKRRVIKKKIYRESKAVEKKESITGEFEPDLFADYQMPVSDYVEYMTTRGAKVLVYDQFKGDFVCQVFNNGLLMASSGMKGESGNLRRMTDDFPQGSEILNRVNRHFGWGNYEIVLVLPDHIYAALRNNIHRAVSEKGLDAKDIVTVFITYKGNSSSLLVNVKEVSGNFGIRKIGKQFRL